MNIELSTLLSDKTIKPKEITETLSKLIVDKKVSTTEILSFASAQKDPAKATCIESLEFATRMDISVATEELLQFVSNTLSAKAPRIKWESAKVIANIAHLYPTKLDTAIKNLLDNTEHTGTVVRWSAATAFAAILKTNTNQSKELIPALESICEREEKNSIKKIYLTAFKKIK